MTAPLSDFDLGMEKADLRVRANLDLEAVELTIAGEVEILLSPTAAIDLVLRLAGALRRLEALKARP